MPEAPAPVLVYDRVAANRRATWRLLALFTVLILPFVAGFIPLLVPAIQFGVLLPALGGAAFDRIQAAGPGRALLFAVTVALALLAVLATGVAVAWLELQQATRLVLRLTRSRPIDREGEPELWRSVENLSLAAGLPTPAVFVIESRSPNAFAVGLDPRRAAVVVTRGLLTLLDRRGLHGVIAHELSHIGNQDTRLNTVLAAVLTVLRLPLDLLSRAGLPPLALRGCLVLSALAAVMAVVAVLAIVAEGALAFWFFASEVRGALAGTSRADLALIAMMIFYGPLIMGSPFYVLFGAQLCGRRVRAAVSRQREFLADADAVLLTRNPEGLALALATVGAAGGDAIRVPRAAAHLFFVEPASAEAYWWDRTVPSHPPIEERVTLLGRMGSGIPPEALAAAVEAGREFRAAPPAAAPAASLAARRRAAPRETARSAPTPAALPADRDGESARDWVAPAGVASQIWLAHGPIPLLERPEAGARARERLPAGTPLALLGVEGAFLRVQTGTGTTGYIDKATAVRWKEPR